MSQELLAQIDQRATALNLTRSQYIAQLARADVATGGDLTLREVPNVVLDLVKSGGPYATPKVLTSDAQQAANEDKVLGVVAKEVDYRKRKKVAK